MNFLLDFEHSEHQQWANQAAALLREWFGASSIRDRLFFLHSVLPSSESDPWSSQSSNRLLSNQWLPSLAVLFYSRSWTSPTQAQMLPEFGRLLSYLDVPVILIVCQGMSLAESEADCNRFGIPVSEVISWRHRVRSSEMHAFVEAVSRHIVVRERRGHQDSLMMDHTAHVPHHLSEDDVQFSAFCPQTVRTGNHFLLEIFGYSPSLRGAVLKLGMQRSRVHETAFKSGVRLTENASIAVQVSFQKFKIEPSVDHVQWTRGIVNSQFVVHVPHSVSSGEAIGTALILANGVEIARILIPVTVRAGWLSWFRSKPKQDVLAERVKSVFASYASVDREEVLRWKQAADALGAKVFVDVMDLRSGDDFESRLWEEIRKCDLFALFWSKAASQSKWVEMEWKLAVKEKGCRFVQPVPLCDPRDVPPPDPLRTCLHFQDLTRIALEYEKLWRQSRSIQAETS